MEKTSKKSKGTRQVIDPVSVSSKRCEDSLKNFCEPGSPFAAEIQVRAETVTPLLKEILEFRPRPHWH
jgi:hypothetical protein